MSSFSMERLVLGTTAGFLTVYGIAKKNFASWLLGAVCAELWRRSLAATDAPVSRPVVPQAFDIETAGI